MTPGPGAPDLGPGVTVSRARPKHAIVFVAAVAGFGVLAMLVAIGIFARQRRASSMPAGAVAEVGGPARVAASQVAKLDFALTQAAFKQAFPTAALDGDKARLFLSGSAFDTAAFTWNDERNHIIRVDLFASKGAVDGATLGHALKPHLGRHFRAQNQYLGASYRGNAGLDIDTGTAHFFLRAAPSADERTDWQARGRALWTLMGKTALGATSTLDPAAQKLLVGYRLSEIAKVDPATPVERAEAHVNQIVPGSLATQVIDLALLVLADHPWFGSVSLSWENKPQGRMTTLQLWNPTGRSDLANPDAIAKCLEPVLGKAEVRVSDHLKNQRIHQWTKAYYERGGNITQNNVWLRLPAGENGTAHFRNLLTTLDECGRLE